MPQSSEDHKTWRPALETNAKYIHAGTSRLMDTSVLRKPLLTDTSLLRKLLNYGYVYTTYTIYYIMDTSTLRVYTPLKRTRL